MLNRPDPDPQHCFINVGCKYEINTILAPVVNLLIPFRAFQSTPEERLSIVGGKRPPQFYMPSYEAEIPESQKKDSDIISGTGEPQCCRLCSLKSIGELVVTFSHFLKFGSGQIQNFCSSWETNINFFVFLLLLKEYSHCKNLCCVMC